MLRSLMPPDGQLILYLGGSGGTGKSRVIQAFVDFARRWHSIASHVIGASSGAAAMLIGGWTIHSALGIGVSPHHHKPSQEHIEAWGDIAIMIVDEFSMVTPTVLNILDVRMRRLKNVPDKPFGGVHMIFCGDFFQLQPVGSCLYTEPSK